MLVKAYNKNQPSSGKSKKKSKGDNYTGEEENITLGTSEGKNKKYCCYWQKLIVFTYQCIEKNIFSWSYIWIIREVNLMSNL